MYLFFLPLACLFLSRELFTILPIATKVSIVQVLDGDTLVLAGGERLRLAMIDAPELGQPTLRGGQNAGQLAKSCLHQILKENSNWTLIYEGRDIYRRLLGDLQNSQIKSLSAELVRRGCASLYAWAEGDQRELWRLREGAQRQHQGLWFYGGFMRPSVWRKQKKGPTSVGPWEEEIN